MTGFFIVIPLISAFSGWLISRIIIQRLLKKSPESSTLVQQQIAIKPDSTISNKARSLSEIEEKVSDPANVEKILPLLETHIDIFLKEKLTAEIPMIGMLIGEKTTGQVKKVFMKELRELFPVLMKQYIAILESELNAEKTVIKKAEPFVPQKPEAFLDRRQAESRSAEITGAVLGFITGVLVVMIIAVIA